MKPRSITYNLEHSCALLQTSILPNKIPQDEIAVLLYFPSIYLMPWFRLHAGDALLEIISSNSRERQECGAGNFSSPAVSLE
jgi:hypothetical protein